MKINLFGSSSIRQGIAVFILEIFFKLCKKYDVDKEWVFTFIAKLKKTGWVTIPSWIEDELNAQIIKTPELLDAKVKADVSIAIEELNLPESGVDKPIFTEVKEGPTALGGEMRLRAPWVKE
ncbi:hypothetical protein SCRM01_111c [Synechococcus phage S-CRM01]|uniref:hypothetical protein n=1 Tax=Synechococcus phage S-CRM01 TaxID=1026955 RepID=UPI000209E3AB|nr:hypothetical protein SCRM01_111c [Synechococcus phage S-CRM01]AEC53057.1 hypothetical protein SCRM01_111c [Synechococcus phage S-CRM01]